MSQRGGPATLYVGKETNQTASSLDRKGREEQGAGWLRQGCTAVHTHTHTHKQAAAGSLHVVQQAGRDRVLCKRQQAVASQGRGGDWDTAEQSGAKVRGCPWQAG